MLKLIFLLLIFGSIDADKPCQPKIFQYSSIVCVCNSTYCDEIDPVEPLQKNHFRLYQSTEGGLRFQRLDGFMNESFSNERNTDFVTTFLFIYNETIGEVVLNVNRNIQYQKVYGFGGAVTDSTGLNFKKMSAGSQENLIRSYYGKTGVEYNMMRIPMGSSDFSTRYYVYGENIKDDIHFSNFSLAPEDFEYKIPMIKRIMNICSEELYIMSAPWSAPEWITAFDRHKRYLMKKYYQSYAEYYVRYLQEFKKQGINIWGVSTGNDAIYFHLNGGSEGLGWTLQDHSYWIGKHLGPTIRKSEFPKTLIFGFDDVRTHLTLWLEEIEKNKKTAKYIDGIALHIYHDIVLPPIVIDEAHQLFPEKIIVQNEACSAMPYLGRNKKIVELGAWGRAVTYFKNLIENFNHWYNVWLDWNLCLDLKGGPNWGKNNKDSSIIISHENDEFYKQPTFYAIGHFSKFVPRGSVHIDVDTIVGDIENVAFLRPDGGVVVILYNSQDYIRKVQIQESGKGALVVNISPHSFSTVIYW